LFVCTGIIDLSRVVRNIRRIRFLIFSKQLNSNIVELICLLNIILNQSNHSEILTSNNLHMQRRRAVTSAAHSKRLRVAANLEQMSDGIVRHVLSLRSRQIQRADTSPADVQAPPWVRA